MMTLKLIFNEEGKILGAQGVGSDGVDKRIDVIATVLRLGGTVTDLTELELCYAPPFSSAKDPVNMAGYVAENLLAGRVDVISTEQLVSYDRKNTILLDVRTDVEFNAGHIQGALHIPVDSLRGRLGELDKDKEILEYCQIGLRGYVASRILTQNGYNVKNLTGGFKSCLLSPVKPGIANPVETSGAQPLIDPETQVIKGSEKKEVSDYKKSHRDCGMC